jgi:hypothetical protein
VKEPADVTCQSFNVENELAGLVGAAFHLFDKDAIGRFWKQLQIRQARIGKPFANLVKALRDHRQRRSSGEQPSNLARRRKIAETIKAVAGFNQTEHGELVDNLFRQLAQRSKLVRGVGLGLLFGGTLSEPLKELSLAGDRNAVGFRPGEAVRWPAIVEKGPTEFADDEDIGVVTPSRGLPPCVRTSAKAAARLIDASRPVKATVPSSAMLSGSTFCVSVRSSSWHQRRPRPEF